MAALRLTPPKAPSLLVSLGVSAGALGLGVLLRIAFLGLDRGFGMSSTYLPAVTVATYFAGWRWGVVTLAASLALQFLAPNALIDDDAYARTLGLYIASCALCILVAASFRRTLLRAEDLSEEYERALKGLEASEQRFRVLADSAPILLWVTRIDGKREFANRAYVDFLGEDYETAINFDWRKVLHPEDLDRILREQVAGETSRELFSLEARYRDVTGEYRWVRSVSQPRYGPDGAFEGFIGIGFDVGAAKQAEADLKRINDLLAERVAAALEERDEAQAALMRSQKLEAVGQLTGGVAHDFNNLLTVVIGALDLMQRHPEDAPRRARMIDAALTAARRGEKLTQQLLAFSRRQALKPEPMRVDDVLRDSEPLLRRAIGEAVTFAINPGAGEAVVNLDQGQFEAALMNLVVNARDATPNGGLIRVETQVTRLGPGAEAPPGDYVCVAVHDTGSGMDEATQARVFEPFFTTKPLGRGTGLGLSQVYGFTRQSGGTASIDSAPGKGASVRLFLPVSHLPAKAIDGAQALDADHRPPLDVLLVEDDLEVGDLVQALLEELGHTVRRAAHADAALKILKRETGIQLLVTDLIMPGDKTGVDLAREAVKLYPALPVILASGYTGETLNAAEDAPWPLLRKPFGAAELGRAIAEVVPPS